MPSRYYVYFSFYVLCIVGKYILSCEYSVGKIELRYKRLT